MLKQRWCKTCKKWSDSSGCEGCGYAGEGFNKSLRTAMLNNHLYSMGEAAKKEHTDSAHFVRAAKAEQKRVAGA